MIKGAEASITKKGNAIVKDRVAKRYRHPELDEPLRQARTRREANILQKLPVNGPKLIETDRKSMITMSFIEGQAVKDVLDHDTSIAHEIGKMMAKLHDADIIHGDLTTSNMIQGKELNLIDFGLSFHSKTAEDKAVDLHLFKQALESKHFTVADEAFKKFKEGYKQSIHSKVVLERLQQVEKRGRNKAKF